jgi:NAD(P)-dependent dehydrogenase (short-subunit alcohol dehydrogenase family)
MPSFGPPFHRGGRKWPKRRAFAINSQSLTRRASGPHQITHNHEAGSTRNDEYQTSSSSSPGILVSTGRESIGPAAGANPDIASKGAVHILTKALVTEWAKSGVRVNARWRRVNVATDMTLKMRERRELFDVWLDMTPMGHIGEPFEIVPAVVYPASAARVILRAPSCRLAAATPSGPATWCQVATASSSCPGLIRGRSRVVH